VCAQVRNQPQLPAVALYPREEHPFGIPTGDAQEDLRADVYKELINKIAWALGSTYRVNYSNSQQAARKYANRVVGRIISDHGFPHSIKK